MIFLDYFSEGESHCDVNASSLVLILKQYPNEFIHLFCNEKHYICLKKRLSNVQISLGNIIFHNIDVYPEVLEYSRFIIDFNLIKQIFDFAKKNNETKIFSTYTTTLFLYYLKLFLILNPSVSAITTFHSVLERLYIFKYSDGFSGIKKIFTILYCFFFGLYLPLSINLKNYKGLVYGESIKQNLLKKVPLIQNNTILTIDIPYIVDVVEYTEPFKNNNVNFGLIGLIDKKKNGTNLLKLLNLLKEQDKKNFKISLIGHIRNKMTENYLKDVLNIDFVERASKDTAFIPKELRDELESQVDYNIYTYNTDGYKMTASGAFTDAVNFEKPIIAIRNEFFDYYFKKFGNIGYLFDNIDDMAEKMIEIIERKPQEEYLVQKENIKKLKKNIDIMYIAENTQIKFETKYGEA